MADVATARAARRERIQRRAQAEADVHALRAGGKAHPPKRNLAEGTYWDALLDRYVSTEEPEWNLGRYRIVTRDPQASKPEPKPARAKRPSSSTRAAAKSSTSPSRPKKTAAAKKTKAPKKKTTAKKASKKKKVAKKKTSRR